MMLLWRPFTRAAKTTGPPKCAVPIKGKAVDPPILPFVEPPTPRGRPGRKAGGWSSTGKTNTSIGDQGEKAAQQLDMVSLLPEGHRQNPLDLRWDGSRWGFELKTVTTESTQYKVKMKAAEAASKIKWAKDNGYRPGMMMMVMDVKKKEALVYWKKGIGSYRLNKSWNFLGRVTL